MGRLKKRQQDDDDDDDDDDGNEKQQQQQRDKKAAVPLGKNKRLRKQVYALNIPYLALKKHTKTC